MLAPDWTWLTSAPVILAAVALFWIPGSLLGAALGAGRWPSIAMAPVLTTSLISVGGILCGAVGIRWALGPILLFCLLLPAILLLIRLLVKRPPRLDAPAVRVGEVLAGGAVAALVAIVTVLGGITHPGDIPQQPDAIFHLGAVRYFLDTGSISSLTANGFNAPDAPGFYPAALQGVTATLVVLTNAPIVIAMQAVLLVTAALIWPLGLIFMTGVFFPGQRNLLLVSGALASVIPGFPFLLLVWGPLWPLEFGFAQIPAVVAVLVLGLAQGFGRKSWLSAALLVVATLPGISLAHTSATFAVLVTGFAFAAGQSWRFAHESERGRGASRWAPLGTLVAGGLAFFYLSTKVASQGMLETSYGRVQGQVQALVDMLILWSPRHSIFPIGGSAVLLLILFGALYALVSRRGASLVVSWAVFMVLGYLTSFLPGSLTWQFTWPWYNLPIRLQGVAAIYGVPLAALGSVWLLHQMRSRWVATGAVVVLAGIVLVQILMNAFVLAKVYGFGGTYALVNSGEVAALREFSRRMPDNAVVAADPWKGGMFLYVVGPEETLVHTVQSRGVDMDLVAAGLDRVRSDPAVCAAVHRQRVTYAITGGAPYVSAGNQVKAYAGIDAVSTAKGFRVVDRSGPYTLWKVPDCQA